MPENFDQDNINIHDDLLRKPSPSSSLIRRIIGILLILALAGLIIFGITKLISVIKPKDSVKAKTPPLKTVKLDSLKYNLIDSDSKVIAIVAFDITVGYKGSKNEELEKDIVERKDQIKDAVFFLIKHKKPRDFYLPGVISESIFENLIEKKKIEKDYSTMNRIIEALKALTDHEYYVKDPKKPVYNLKQNLTEEEEKKILGILELTGVERSYFTKEELRIHIFKQINAILIKGQIDDIFITKFNLMFN